MQAMTRFSSWSIIQQILLLTRPNKGNWALYLQILLTICFHSVLFSIALLICNTAAVSARRGHPAVYLTDLDFADDIVLFGSTIHNAQKLLTNLEKMALTVGLRINLSKTEYILVGEWDNRKQRDIKIKSGILKRVDDYKYLGSWLLNSLTSKFFLRFRSFTWLSIFSLFMAISSPIHLL